MYPRKFDYYAPKTLSQALQLISEKGEDAKILAGGQSLIPMMKLRLASPAFVVDLNGIKELSYIKSEGGTMKLGSMTRHADIEHSSVVASKAPIMVEAASQIADQQVRNLGTIGGSLCHADPSADWPAVVLALDAELEAKGTVERVIRSKDFFKGPFETALSQAEILTEVRFRIPPAKSGYSYTKFERKAGDFATVGVATQLEMGEDGTVSKARIALTAAGPAPFRAEEAEKLITGQRPTAELVEKAAKAASDASDPAPDLRGSAEYKKDMARVFTKRSIRSALERAGVSI
ncbi:MAG: xanthine dehydrogenase family protein subunit M [Nitrososphaerota archaeon]|nr:xanthine dehydrogenase family protein subunit M [Nitrososphaerota archaeon]